MKRRGFMMVLGSGGAMVALTACDALPPSAVQPWQGPPDGQTEPRLRALAWAMLAPNPHNLQSWIADLREPGAIHLHVDGTRLLPETDPHGRQILIGCGAFVELLRMAAAQDGWLAQTTWLPQGPYADDRLDDRPFATVRLQRAPGVQPDPLFAAVRERRTTRSAYEARVPDAAALQALQRAADSATIRCTIVTAPAAVARVAALAIQGYGIEFGNPAAWGETARLMRVGAPAVAQEPSGIALLGTEVWLGRQVGMLTPDALAKVDGIAARRAIESSTAAARSTPAWAWLASADNSRRAQLDAGRATLRFGLQAAQLKLAVHPNSQVLQEFQAMDGALRAFHAESGLAAPARAQMLMRVGYAAPPDPSPRRPLEQVVRI